MFSPYRRDLIARTWFDLVKIALAGALASKFFVEFPRPVQISIGVIVVGLWVLGLVTCPQKPPGKE